MKYEALPHSTHELVTLRPIQVEDIPAWFDYLSMPEVVEHTSWNLQGAGELGAYVWSSAVREAAGPLRLAIVRRSDDRLVGTIGFHSVRPMDHAAEITYDLAPEVWGRGIATNMCALMVAWAHAQPGYRRIQATVLDSNQRSVRVLERCGFEQEGLLRSYRSVRGNPGDFWMYAHVDNG